MDERSTQRVVTEQTIPATIGGLGTKLRLRDLSTEGCMVETTNVRVEAGSKLSFRFPGDLVIDGCVIWQKGPHAGVRFFALLDAAVVDYLGFKPLLVDLNRKVPRDRFGRELPNLSPFQAITGALLGERYR